MVDRDFGQWAAGQYRGLLQAAFLLTGDRHSAQDLVQVALAKTQVAWRRVRSNPDAYVRRVLIRAHTDWWRRQTWRETPVVELPIVSTVGGERVVDLRDALLGALRSLTARQRACVVLRHYYELSEQEAADVMGCSVGTVKSTASRALAQLRQHPGLLEMKEYS